jgi:E3 ubiquitin-protein ligase HERC1
VQVQGKIYFPVSIQLSLFLVHTHHFNYAQVMKVDRAPDGLPTAQTCFFQLRLPPYSSQEVMAERLRYAINNCRSIDMDNYMLARNTDIGQASDDEY